MKDVSVMIEDVKFNLRAGLMITCNDEKYLIIEGHSRMTVYGFNPDKLEGTYAYVGYCSPE